MKLTDLSLRNPYALTALVLAVAVLGLASYWTTPRDLFPETTPPQAVVIAPWAGASAEDVADNVTRVLEKELATLSGVDDLTSTSRDGVAAIRVAFGYHRDPGAAVTEVSNALDRVGSDLPADMGQPQVHAITPATQPAMTLAVRPGEASPKDLATVRLLADNPLQDRLLALEAVGDVEVFGGPAPEVRVAVDRDRLRGHGLSLEAVVGELSRRNLTVPAGRIYTEGSEYQVTVDGRAADAEAVRSLPLHRGEAGSVTVGDVAEVRLAEQEARSLYHGNGEPAVGLNILRPLDGANLAAIEAVQAELPALRAEFPDLRFETASSQESLIRANASGMRQSVLQAVILTVAVIFVFLADRRASAVAAVSIPLAFLAALAMLGASPYTLNMVTMAGLIIAVGLVIDSSVVVLENIYRHHQDGRKDAVRSGSGEVALAVTAGLLTTVVVLLPVMFAGGYIQRIMRPLNLTIAVTLIASLLVALTVVPAIAARLLARRQRAPSRTERLVGRTQGLVDAMGDFFQALLRAALRRRWLTLLLAGGFLVGTMRVVPGLIGNELMPPMDTGIVTVSLDTPSHYRPERVERVLARAEERIAATPGVERISSVVGSEPGKVSFGAGGATAQTAELQVELVPRTEREASIWDIQDRWRTALRDMEGVRTFTVSEYGATPISTTKAPLDIILSGPDPATLHRLGNRVLERLEGQPGLVDVTRSWYPAKPEQQVRVDPELARLYGTSTEAVGSALQAAVDGVPAGALDLEGFLDIPVTVAYREGNLTEPGDVGAVPVATDHGFLPLRALAGVSEERAPPVITREDLRATLDITAVNRDYTIAQVAAEAERRLADLDLPAGYDLMVGGTVADLEKNQGRMRQALLVGIALLYLVLVALFRSFRHPLAIMAAIPLAAAGALWGLLLFGKPMCMPAIMGIILLGGTVVNNSILLLDFVERARAEGMERAEALLASVRLRMRPVLMTTVSTIIGLTPLVFEMAVGLERMSPLGVAAAVGLAVGSLWTLVVVPVVYTVLEDAPGALRRWSGLAR